MAAFFELPLPIRQEIYFWALHSPYSRGSSNLLNPIGELSVMHGRLPPEVVKMVGARHFGTASMCAVLLVCRAFYYEGVDVLYRRFQFHFASAANYKYSPPEELERLDKVLTRMGPLNRCNISRLVMDRFVMLMSASGVFGSQSQDEQQMIRGPRDLQVIAAALPRLKIVRITLSYSGDDRLPNGVYVERLLQRMLGFARPFAFRGVVDIMLDDLRNHSECARFLSPNKIGWVDEVNRRIALRQF